MGKLRKLDKERRRIGRDIAKPFESLAGQLTGKDAEDAALEAAGIQATAADEASALFDPFQQLGQQGLDQSQFLTDPQAQFDFLQNNPLFKASLDNANTATNKLAAARGRLSAGDTFQQLSKNTLLAASPLIQQQKGSILDSLGFGERTAANQANLRTGKGAALAGGVVGGQNARSAGFNNILNLGSQIAGAFAGIPPGIGPTLGQQDALTNLTNQNTSDVSSLISGNLRG